MIKKTNFKNLFLIKNQAFKDPRGYFKEIIRENKLKQKFPFLVMSYSKKDVIRGLHIQSKNPQGKFITVVKGKIFDVAVDLRKNSKTYLKHFRCVLSDKNSTSIYIPPGFAHGFYTYDKENIVLYGCTNYRDKHSESGIIWDDKDLKIKWPNKKPILSKKDKLNITLKDYLSTNAK